MKRKNIITSLIGSIIVILIAVWWWYHQIIIIPTVVSVPTTAKLGTAPSCMGKGICTMVAGTQTGQGAFADTFSNPGSNTFPLTMTFMAGSSGINATTYSFDFPFDVSMSNSVLRVLGYPAGTIIKAGTVFSITPTSIPGEVISTLPTGRSVPATTGINVIFGGVTNSGAYDPSATGIYTISATPMASTNATPASISANLGLQSGNAQNIILAFSSSDLSAAQPSQFAIMFPGGTMASSYQISNTTQLSQLSLPALVPVLLPGCAAVVPATCSLGTTRAITNGTTITIPYSMNCVSIPGSAVTANSGIDNCSITFTGALPATNYICTYFINADHVDTAVCSNDQAGNGSVSLSNLSTPANYTAAIVTMSSSTVSCTGSSFQFLTGLEDRGKDKDKDKDKDKKKK